MAHQLSGPQLMEWAQKALTLSFGEGMEAKYPNLGAMLDGEVADPKERSKMGTALVVLSTLTDEGLTAHDVRQVIRWRNEKGEPGQIEIHYNNAGREKRALFMQEQRKAQTLREAIKMFGPMFLFR